MQAQSSTYCCLQAQPVFAEEPDSEEHGQLAPSSGFMEASVYPRLLTAANWGFSILAAMSGILVLLGIAVLVGAAMVRWWAPPPSSMSRSLDFDYTRSTVTAEASFISDLRSKTEVGPPHVASTGWPHLRGRSRCVHAASSSGCLRGRESFSMQAGLLHLLQKTTDVAAVEPHCDAVVVLQARWLRPGQHFSVDLDLILAEPPASFVLQVTSAA